MGTTIHPDAERLHAYDAQVRRMIADPDMTADVLAVGLAIAWLCREHDPDALSSHKIAQTARLTHYQTKRTFREDAPRWQMEIRREARCEAPMIRRPGLCGKSTTLGFSSQNWDDGTRTYHTFCTRHHQYGEQLNRDLMARDKRLREERGGPPVPAPNTGGILARHFPRIAWKKVYAWARPGWVPPASVPEQYAAPPLQLIVGADEPEEAVSGGQPALTVHFGMPDRLSSGRGTRRGSGPRTGPRPL